jgi:hypothetical protein
MNRHLLLLLLCAGCFDDAVLAPQIDAGNPPPDIDASIVVDAGSALPPGVEHLATGNYLSFATHVANNKIYGVEYTNASITAQPVRIVAIDSASGAVETFYDLGADTRAPTNLQATDTALFWLRHTDSGSSLFRKSFGTSTTVDPVVVPGLSQLPAGYSLDQYALYPTQGKIYVLLTKGNTFELGSVPIGSSPSSAQPYTMLATGAIPDATSVTFVDVTSTLAISGRMVYAGGYAAGTDKGFVTKMDIMTHTSTTIASSSTRMRSFVVSGARVEWISEGATAARVMVADPLNDAHDGAFATVPSGTYGMVLHSGSFYVTSLPGTATDLGLVQLGIAAAEPPTGTTTMVASIPTCVGQSTQTCAVKISLPATDTVSVYYSTTTDVYKYTP